MQALQAQRADLFKEPPGQGSRSSVGAWTANDGGVSINRWLPSEPEPALFGFLESVAEVAAKLKEPKIANCRCEAVVVDAEKAAVLMRGLDQAVGCPVFRGTFAGHAKFFVRNRT